jgi:histidyl-tRNA synthetase
MSGQSFQAPVGTHDVLAPESARWTALIARFAGIAERYGFGMVHSPLFEDVAVFHRLGEGTDAVRKEMYDFEDKGGRRVALRPEGTASVVRAFVQHRPVTPWKAWYVTPAFRYESPQAGRYRQHHQVGVEVLGTADPDVDVEVLALGHEYLRSLGLTQFSLHLNSMGSREDRRRYIDAVRDELRKLLGELAPEDQKKVEDHPLRVLDSKRSETRAATTDVPSILDFLDAEAAAHFDRVQEGLKAAGIAYEIDPRLVRGLDYYTNTTFEFVSSAIDAAQSTIMGGGRYDGLAEDLGGPATPGIGFGSGIERVLIACDAEGVFPAPARTLDVFVVDVTGGEEARALCTQLRDAGLRTDRAYDQRSMKAQMKLAGRSTAPVAVIVGEDERAAGTAVVRPLGGGDQVTVARAELLPAIRSILETP